MGVIGSSEMTLFASGGCASGCGIADDSNKPANITTQIIVIQRQRRTNRRILPLLRMVRLDEPFLRNMPGDFRST
jgi:hypothetical protein